MHIQFSIVIRVEDDPTQHDKHPSDLQWATATTSWCHEVWQNQVNKASKLITVNTSVNVHSRINNSKLIISNLNSSFEQD